MERTTQRLSDRGSGLWGDHVPVRIDRRLLLRGDGTKTHMEELPDAQSDNQQPSIGSNRPIPRSGWFRDRGLPSRGNVFGARRHKTGLVVASVDLTNALLLAFDYQTSHNFSPHGEPTGKKEQRYQSRASSRNFHRDRPFPLRPKSEKAIPLGEEGQREDGHRSSFEKAVSSDGGSDSGLRSESDT